MKTSADILNEKQAILNFISESNDSNLITRLKEVVDSFRSSNQDDDIVIPEWHKELVRKRIKNTKTEDYISREELNNLITV